MSDCRTCKGAVLADHEVLMQMITVYAAKLQEIYDGHTAGDYTFVGVLAEFVRAVSLER